MTPEEIRQDGIRSFELALATLRQRYLAERKPGESAKEWRERCK